MFGERDRGLLARLAVDSSPFSRDAIEMAFNVGSQNAGRMIKALIIAADEQAYLLMENECRQLARHDDNETTAAHMLPADDAGEQED